MFAQSSSPTMQVCLIGLNGGLVGIDEGETCLAGLGRGKHALEGLVGSG